MTASGWTTRPGRIAELVGPPGAGKSSVFRALLGREVSVERRPGLPSLGARGTVARSLVTSISTLVRTRGFARRLDPEQVRMMTYLHAVPRIFAERPAAAERILVFDQGPLFLLSRPSIDRPALRDWREHTIDEWARLLDVVVVLDAPDTILADRINDRDEWHRLQGAPEVDAVDDIVATRRRYEDLVAAFAARPDGPEPIRFDTSGSTPERIADEILDALGAPSRAAVGRRAAASP